MWVDARQSLLSTPCGYFRRPPANSALSLTEVRNVCLPAYSWAIRAGGATQRQAEVRIAIISGSSTAFGRGSTLG